MRSESGSVEEARDVFKHMKRLHIGCDDADMYISWASLETTEGKGKKAMEILQRAQERGARVQQAPIEAAIAKLNGGEPLPMPDSSSSYSSGGGSSSPEDGATVAFGRGSRAKVSTTDDTIVMKKPLPAAAAPVPPPAADDAAEIKPLAAAMPAALLKKLERRNNPPPAAPAPAPQPAFNALAPAPPPAPAAAAPAADAAAAADSTQTIVFTPRGENKKSVAGGKDGKAAKGKSVGFAPKPLGLGGGLKKERKPVDAEIKDARLWRSWQWVCAWKGRASPDGQVVTKADICSICTIPRRLCRRQEQHEAKAKTQLRCE